MNGDANIGGIEADGLTTEEAKRRLGEYGPNEVAEKKTNPLIKFGKKFWGVTPWMLELTMVLELALSKTLEAYFIVGLLCFNAIIGYIQEEKANNAVALLRKRLLVNARVKRNSEWSLFPSRELVPGDIIRLRAGDMTPADTKLLDGHLEVDQSARTGESLTGEMKTGETLYSGSVVKSGEATGVASDTGTKTYFGKTAELVQIARPKLHIEEMISKVVLWLLIMVVVAVAPGMGLAILRGMDPAEITPSSSYSSSRRSPSLCRARAATMDVLCAERQAQ